MEFDAIFPGLHIDGLGTPLNFVRGDPDGCGR